MRVLTSFKAKVLVLAALVALTTACTTEQQSATTPQSNAAQAAQAVQTRAQVMQRANAVAPVPDFQNFPMRQALVDFAQRTDMVNHPWYVYILGDNGNVIYYFVATTKPINSCNFLSSSEDFVTKEMNNGVDPNQTLGAVLQAPSLDGMYYGSSQCDAWFFFDAGGTMIEIRDTKYFVSDSPLSVEAEAIGVTPRP